MVRYPKFLNSKPRFWGLSLTDILIFAAGINIFYHIGLKVFFALGLTVLLIGLRLVAVKWIDFKGVFLSYPKVGTLSWSDKLKGGKL